MEPDGLNYKVDMTKYLKLESTQFVAGSPWSCCDEARVTAPPEASLPHGARRPRIAESPAGAQLPMPPPSEYRQKCDG